MKITMIFVCVCHRIISKATLIHSKAAFSSLASCNRTLNTNNGIILRKPVLLFSSTTIVDGDNNPSQFLKKTTIKNSDGSSTVKKTISFGAKSTSGGPVVTIPKKIHNFLATGNQRQIGTTTSLLRKPNTLDLLNREAEKDISWSTIEVPKGICIGVTLEKGMKEQKSSSEKTRFHCKFSQEVIDRQTHWVRQVLHPDEVNHASTIESDATRNTFLLGRLAMRAALMQSTLPHTSIGHCSGLSFPFIPRLNQDGIASNAITSNAILRDEHGRPGLPNGFLGSIAHKQDIGVALVFEQRNDSTMGVGVDIERCKGGSPQIANRILTQRERDDLGTLKSISKDEEVFLRFSLKKSLYKAMHPLICQHVGFQEVEIKPQNDGTAIAKYYMESNAHQQFASTELHWQKLDDIIFLTSAYVTLKQ